MIIPIVRDGPRRWADSFAAVVSAGRAPLFSRATSASCRHNRRTHGDLCAHLGENRLASSGGARAGTSADLARPQSLDRMGEQVLRGA